MSGVSDSLVSGNDGGNSAVDGDGLALAAAVARHYRLTLGQDRTGGDHHYLYQALALALRDRLVGRWRDTREQAGAASGQAHPAIWGRRCFHPPGECRPGSNWRQAAP